ncbi:MAG: hypothetical protein EZS28_005968 [Streblomastix strix]|uniref:Uncharacterized protein n=1 Tax=Streblomastix strix TaxID=222440 RepID=A0A5J4WVA1_9EUKA|nr:MAG: hypothetical protein EZS28_005968 [Streblomastix strix]
MEQLWECETPQQHCPISLIPAVIYKVELEQVKGIIIAPIWRGQVWWTALMRITIHWKKLLDSQSVLKEGVWMKRNKQKLPPGKIGIFMVDGERKQSNYSTSAYYIQYQQDNQYKEQQKDGTEAGRDTHPLQQYLQSIELNKLKTVLQLSTLEQRYPAIANYITYLKPLESDACIIQAKNSNSTVFELMGKQIIFKGNKRFEQLMNKHVNRATKNGRSIKGGIVN